jgi:hypothetical protein
MGKSIFHPSCKKTKYYKVKKVNFDQVLNVGTAHLKSKCHLLVLWSIKNYPTEEQMPGSPYPIKVEVTIVKKHHDHHLKSMSGEFVFELNSGTLPQLNSMGLPDGEYHFLARFNNRECSRKVCLSMNNGCNELIIKKNKY